MIRRSRKGPALTRKQVARAAAKRCGTRARVSTDPITRKAQRSRRVNKISAA